MKRRSSLVTRWATASPRSLHGPLSSLTTILGSTGYGESTRSTTSFPATVRIAASRLMTIGLFRDPELEASLLFPFLRSWGGAAVAMKPKAALGVLVIASPVGPPTVAFPFSSLGELFLSRPPLQ